MKVGDVVWVVETNAGFLVATSIISDVPKLFRYKADAVRSVMPGDRAIQVSLVPVDAPAPSEGGG